MESNQHSAAAVASTGSVDHRRVEIRQLSFKWAIVVLSGVAVYLAPTPSGIAPESWRLLAVFVATIVGLIVQPVPGGAMVLLSIGTMAVTRSMPISEAVAKTVTDPRALETLRLKSILAGYADPVVWLVLAAFFMSRGMIKTGLGRRIALFFIRAIGHRSLGLGYALVSTDVLLATVIPSNTARSGGIIFPVSISVAEAYNSKPGPTAGRLGAFLISMIYQSNVIGSAMFLTGQAGNLLIQKFAQQTAGIDLSYVRWMVGGIIPGLVSLMVVPPLIYRLFPPEVKHTPEATRFAQSELDKLGPMSRHEVMMLCVFGLVALLWTTTAFHGIDYAVVALVGICVLLLAKVLDWGELIAEKAAWDVFIWYGGLVRMAEALGEAGITRKFAQAAAGYTAGWKWWAALALLALVYFYAHYAFASISAHALAMYTPFLVVVTVAGAPSFLAVALLAYLSNLSAGLTHYGTAPGPIYFGAGYVSQQKWWQLGLIASIPNILIWAVVGLVWWKILGWW